MAILVDGGTGYIGSHIVRRLLEMGEEVLVVDALYSGSRAPLPEQVSFIKEDIGNQRAMKQLFSHYDIEAVMHLAAFTSVEQSVREPLKYFHNNVCATVSLLEVMKEAGTPYMISSSSASVYGITHQELVDEETPTRPVSPYGASKLAMEQVIRMSGMKATILRYFNVAGACGEHRVDQLLRPTNLIPRAIESLLKGSTLKIFGKDYATPDGTGVRDYIHVLDVVEAHVQALKRLRQGQCANTYNLGYGRGYSVMDIIRGLEEIQGEKMTTAFAPRRAGDPASIIGDGSRARAELHWKPRHDSLQEILGSSLAWYQRQGW